MQPDVALREFLFGGVITGFGIQSQPWGRSVKKLDAGGFKRRLNGRERGRVGRCATGILKRVKRRIADDRSTRKLMPCPTEQATGGPDLREPGDGEVVKEKFRNLIPHTATVWVAPSGSMVEIARRAGCGRSARSRDRYATRAR
jgi:hypothetical protein